MSDTRQRIAGSVAELGSMEIPGAELALVADGELHTAPWFSGHLSQQDGFVYTGAISA